MVNPSVSFSPFDFFGKSIPGAVLILGLIPLLPQRYFKETIRSTGTFSDLAAILVIVFILGMLIGEAIHTLSNLFEKFFHKWFFKYDSSGIERKMWGSRKRNLLLKRLYFMYRPHRDVFNDVIEDRDVSDEKVRNMLDIQFEYFNNAFIYFGIEDVEGKDGLYPMVMSCLSQEQNCRSERFEVIYLLCRGMWAVFLILLILYITSACLYVPIWTTISGPEVFLIDILPLLTLLSLGLIALVFLIASKDYKRAMIEYILADFCVFVRDRLNDGEERSRGDPNDHSTQPQ